ncbi:hypothetical protein GWI33_014158 [Rhynchophorus ferrugineus]|uniref:Uncharacterized protein n=1 Tax=Rhynchophorus ferrugineus TaxID=354439 RepID=A0A834I273_RHYFE|nr:hypothetical protein GWI33_014158 [Rhynchophorus ferrugineus]
MLARRRGPGDPALRPFLLVLVCFSAVLTRYGSVAADKSKSCKYPLESGLLVSAINANPRPPGPSGGSKTNCYSNLRFTSSMYVTDRLILLPVRLMCIFLCFSDV